VFGKTNYEELREEGEKEKKLSRRVGWEGGELARGANREREIRYAYFLSACQY